MATWILLAVIAVLLVLVAYFAYSAYLLGRVFAGVVEVGLTVFDHYKSPRGKP
jgi:hypothetical protein